MPVRKADATWNGDLQTGEGTMAVESGAYEGTIQELNAEESEIYISAPGRGTLELYFTESTRLVRKGPWRSPN